MTNRGKLSNNTILVEKEYICRTKGLYISDKISNALEKIPIEISITPNRGDATSVYGIARDLSACDYGK